MANKFASWIFCSAMAAISIAFPTALEAEMISVNLTLTPVSGTTNLLNYTLDFLGLANDRDSATVSGDLTVDLEISDLSVSMPARIERIDFTGGILTLTDLNLDVALASPPSNLTVTTTDLQVSINTPGQSGLVVTGAFDADDHKLIINGGVGAITGSGLFDGLDGDILDFNADAVSATPVGQGHVAVGLFDVIGNIVTWEVSLTVPFDSSIELIDEDGSPTGFVLSTDGSVEASGQFQTVVPEPASLALLVGLLPVFRRSRGR